MAEIILGIGTSHSPMLSLDASLWNDYAANDRNHPDLVFPPDGLVRPFDEAVKHHVPQSILDQPRTVEVFQEQSDRCSAALVKLTEALKEAEPDVTIIVSDDQDEWFFEDMMPAFAVFWGESLPLVPREVRPGDPIGEAIRAGYGDVELEVPVDRELGLHLVTSLMDNDFDMAQFTYVNEMYGGRVGRRYPSPDGARDRTHETPQRRQGLPHGYSFVVKRLFNNHPGKIVPIFQNTCYPPNAVTPRRCYSFGTAIGEAVKSWPSDARVAIIASGGLSHFVVDEEIDLQILKALEEKNEEALTTLPRERLRSATSESLNWVTVGAAVHDLPLQMEVLDYVPIYRTEAGTGGGWAFAKWA